MMKRIVSSFLLLCIMMTGVAFAQGTSGDMTMIEKATVVEKIVYGSEQTGSLVERANKLDKDLFGQEGKEALVSRVDKLYSFARENTVAAPSLVIRLNAVEWTLTRGITSAPAKNRMDAVEKALFGNTAQVNMADRLLKVEKTALTDARLDAVNVTLSKDSLVRVKLLTSLNTKSSRVEEPFSFQAVEDVYAGGALVIAKGASGIGKVAKVEPARNFGRDGKIELSFETIELMDGTLASVFVGEKAKEETRSMAKAAGATVAGLVILGPVGVIGGAFVHGEDAVIPAGAEMYIQVKSDIEAYGMKVK